MKDLEYIDDEFIETGYDEVIFMKPSNETWLEHILIDKILAPIFTVIAWIIVISIFLIELPWIIKSNAASNQNEQK